MNEVSIIINGVRYDAVCVNKDLSHPSCCNVCDIGSFCIQGDTCLCYTFDIDNNFVFKKSDKKLNSMESVIKWQTGEPKESGEYLVTLISGKVRVAEFYKYKVADKEYWGCTPCGIVGVKAWCKLRDIEPYKEETK